MDHKKSVKRRSCAELVNKNKLPLTKIKPAVKRPHKEGMGELWGGIVWSLNLNFTELLMHYGNCTPFTFTVCILLAMCKVYCSVGGVLETLQFFKFIQFLFVCISADFM